MISYQQLLTLGFYELSPFTGSDGEKCFKIEKTNADDEKKLIAYAWKGPFAFDHTSDDDKRTFLTEFSQNGLCEISDWLNSLSFD